jgi:AraC-like DNA-binding protein
MLLDTRHGCYYMLNELAARVWATIETSPSGIAAEDIIDVLEMHCEIPREELARDATQCLKDLQMQGLIGKSGAADDESSAEHITSSPARKRARESEHGGQVMIYEQQFVQRYETVESLADQLFQQGLEGNIDWRVKKLKDFIDNAPAKVHGSLGDVCKQLQLLLSERQTRRLFKDSTGISIREYARKRRLVLAARRLQNTDEPIKVVATDAGYQTLQGFEKGFHDMFRLTPVEFRRVWRQSQVTA